MKRKTICITLCLLATMATAAQTAYAHKWQGKRVAYLGDSVTDPRNKAAKTKYWGFLEQWLGITPYVYAVSGREWNDVPRQAAKLKAEHGDSVDAIIVFMGTNDYNQGVPIGRWFDERVEKVVAGINEQKHPVDRRRRYHCMDADTYRGRINIALDTLKRMYPTKQIVLLTPIHRAGFFANEKNWQPAEDYTNRCGEYIDAYVESVKQAANIWAVTVIDLNALCGLFPMMDEHAQYFNNKDTDRLHPNDAGHERIARTLAAQLEAIAPL